MILGIEGSKPGHDQNITKFLLSKLTLSGPRSLPLTSKSSGVSQSKILKSGTDLKELIFAFLKHSSEMPMTENISKEEINSVYVDF